MVLITTIRAPRPMTEPPSPSTAEPLNPGRSPPGTGPVVASPMQAQSAQQAPVKPTWADPQLLAARTTAKTNATEAAEAARQAYIRASIAAGINPLPVP
jgi:hypothetical protein